MPTSIPLLGKRGLDVAESSAPISGRNNGASLRAVAALLLVVAVPSAIIAFASDLDGALARIAGSHRSSVGPWLDASIAALMLVLALAGSLLLRQPIRRGHGSPGLTVAALPIGIIAPAVALGLAGAAGAATVSSGPPMDFALFLAGSLLIMAKATGEEILFRGLLQPLLCRAWGVPVGIVLAALAFTAIHVVGGWRDPVSLLNITLAGGWFGLLAWRTGGVLAPILAHSGYNWAEEMLYGASPNPGTGSFGALVDMDLAGHAWLGGSADGLNASLLLTAVLIAIILPLVLRRPFAEETAMPKTGPGA
jgi:hypothetical protein